MTLSIAEQKQLAATAAAQLVQNGDIVGLGTGSTAAYLVEALGARARAGLRCTCVPTSDETARRATQLGLSLGRLDDYSEIGIDIDGADEVDPSLNLIKGLGGALLREKLVARTARRFVVVVDETKLVERLGKRARVPVEVVPFGWTQTRTALQALGADAVLRQAQDERRDGEPFRSDSGNYILDCHFTSLAHPAALAATIKGITGVVEHGLFLGMATEVLVGHGDGSVERLRDGVRRQA
jgi:ribose 5-phosphate isomerase A